MDELILLQTKIQRQIHNLKDKRVILQIPRKDIENVHKLSNKIYKIEIMMISKK